MYPPEPIDRQQLDLGALLLAQPLCRIEHRVVLDRGDEHPPAPIVLGRGATSRGP